MLSRARTTLPPTIGDSLVTWQFEVDLYWRHVWENRDAKTTVQDSPDKLNTLNSLASVLVCNPLIEFENVLRKHSGKPYYEARGKASAKGKSHLPRIIR